MRRRILNLLECCTLMGAIALGGTNVSGATLVSCEEGVSGDLIRRGFYIPEYPGHSLGTVTLYFSAAEVGDYTLSLSVRRGSYDGPMIGASSQTARLSDNMGEGGTPVTFDFGNAPVSTGETVTFELSQTGGPDVSVFYGVPGFGGAPGCPVIQTNGTDAPLDTERREGVKIQIRGNEVDLIVEGEESIQDAIDAASPGDTVRVEPGTYRETFSMRDGIHVIGAGMNQTIIEGTGGAVVTANAISDARLEGFHIRAAGSGEPTTDGIQIQGGSLMVSGNKVTNTADGIRVVGGSSAVVQNNFVCDNGNAENDIVDYGIIVLRSTPLITNNRVCRNEVGIYVAWPESAGARLINNTVVENESDGIWLYNEAHAVVKNNIVVGNSVGISTLDDAIPELSYNNVWNNRFRDYDEQQGGVATPGVGSISVDPLFEPAQPDQFYLMEGSPSIDAGDPLDIFNDPDGSRNDMGYLGGARGSAGSGSGSVASGFVFTAVGNIPVSEITQSGASRGLANVSADASSALSIPAYKDAPFGRKIWLKGLFGDFDDNVAYYRLFIAPVSGGSPPSPSDFEAMDDPLTKVRYFIDGSGRVTSRRINVGPDDGGFYQRTNDGFWAHPDLKLVWDTRRFDNGVYQIRIEAFDAAKNPVALPANDQDEIFLWVDNSSVTAEIVEVRYLDAPAPECAILNLGSDSDNIAFVVTASHPNGFLHSFNLGVEYGSNRSAGSVVSQRYRDENDGSRPTWNGVIAQTFNSVDATGLDPWTTCAYQFDLRAQARTTTGFSRIYRGQFDENLTLDLGGTGGGLIGDLDGDGDVDGDDLAILASNFGAVDEND